jgi:hypothetical protein
MASLAGIGMVHGSCNDFVVESEYQMQADSSKDSSKSLASWVLKGKPKRLIDLKRKGILPGSHKEPSRYCW